MSDHCDAPCPLRRTGTPSSTPVAIILAMSRRHSVTRSRTSLRARSSARTSSAQASNSSARTTSGPRSKPNAVSIAPPCPLRAKRLPFGLSRRMTRPQSTSAARCRRSVAGAMPCARSASCWLEGNTIRPSPLSVVSGWKVNRASTLDPDEQAQSVIRLVFDLFDRLRTVSGVLRYLVQNDIKMPVRLTGGPGKGELEWRRPSRPSLGDLFSNPIYAGVYVYGVRPIDGRRHKPGHPGSGRRPPRPESAEVFLPDRMPAYISWDQFQRNQEQIRANRTSEQGPTRAGA